MYQQRNMFGSIPTVVKNLLIINGLVFFATYIFSSGVSIPGLGFNRIDLNQILGLYTPGSNYFNFWQYFTYMFMHANITHVFFNMFALYMFGRVLEKVWGAQKFLFYYLATGIGAGLLYVLIAFIRAKYIAAGLPPELVSDVYTQGLNLLETPEVLAHKSDVISLLRILNIPLVGASGAVFGLLLAFGMMFPNEQIYLYMVMPVKAKYFVMGYAAIEIYLMLQNNPGDNVAHLAHLGGMLFGYFLIRYWKKRNF